jgi:hypothetical protein
MQSDLVTDHVSHVALALVWFGSFCFLRRGVAHPPLFIMHSQIRELGVSSQPVSRNSFDFEFGQCSSSYLTKVARALCTLCCRVCSRCEACVATMQECEALCALKGFSPKAVILTVTSRSPRIPGICPRASTNYSVNSILDVWTKPITHSPSSDMTIILLRIAAPKALGVGARLVPTYHQRRARLRQLQ